MSENDNRLTLVREITRSGVATVWEGYDVVLDRKVLVKSIHPQFAREPDLRARFIREAKAIAKLSHPNVVQIYDLHEDGDELDLFLEYIEGTTLGRFLKENGSLPPEAALPMIEEILSGLDHAHAAGIIHRDLKPDNVLISTRGDVKITDFGLATLKDQPSVTMEGMVVGTPQYMAPEQAEGGEITRATDVFAAGLMLFEMLTGTRIHGGDTMAGTVQSVLRYQPPDFSRFAEQIPPAVVPVLNKMLERDPTKRFQTAQEAKRALLAAGPDDRLPATLVKDYLSTQHTRGPVAPSVARVRARSKPLRTFIAVTIAVTAGALIFHFATLTKSPSTSTDSPSAGDDSLAVRSGTLAGDSAVSTTMDKERHDTAVQDGQEQFAGNVPIEPNIEPSPVTPRQQPLTMPGYLDIVSRPWAQVYLEDSLLGTTPLGNLVKLPEGMHRLIFLNSEIGLPITRDVSILPADTTELRMNLYDHVARIRIASVRPWADVFINGVMELRTPSSKIIFKPLGTYTLTLKNPDYPVWSEDLAFHEGDPIREIRVDLTKPNP